MVDFRKEIKDIKNDNIHGATYLTKKSVELLKKLSFDDAVIAANMLLKTQPYMASIYNFAKDFLKNRPNNIENFCSNWWDEFEKENQKVIQKASKILNNRKILTHSFSSVVYKALLNSKNIEVLCTESRPKNEGVELAKKLKESNIKTTFIIDAAAPYFIKDIDIVIIGADGVGDFGVVHKVGTFPIALAAKYYDKPFIVLAHNKKYWPKGFKLPAFKYKSPKEILDFDIDIKNIYFDITPMELIGKIIV